MATNRANNGRAWGLCLIACLLVLLTACGGGGGSSGHTDTGTNTGNNNQGNNDQDNDTDEEFTCPSSIESLKDNLDTHIPTWEEIDCFAGEATRPEEPDFVKRVLLGPENVPEDSTAWEVHLAEVEQSWLDFPINVSNSIMGFLPPYESAQGGLVTYPLSPEDLDARLRSFSAVLLYEKLVHNRPVFMVNFWPPGTDVIVGSEQEFSDWLDDFYLPEKLAEAQMAERVKADYYIPLHLEVEVFMNGLGDWFDVLSETEKLAIAQDFVDRIYDTVRPHYTGVLIAHSYARYAAIGDFWTGISYAEFDLLNLALFPECSVEQTQAYLDEQLEGYMTVVARDGLPYWINELTVYGDKLFEQPCPDTDFEAIEADVYQTVFDAVDALPIAPSGMSIALNEIRTDTAKQVILDYFNSH